MRALAAALLLSACVGPLDGDLTSYTETDTTVTIHKGIGGKMSDNSRQYDRWRKLGKRVIIDGHVISADAFFSFGSPGACYTGRAVFSPHAISWYGIYPLREHTERAANMLPPPLRDWFKGHHSYYLWINYPRVTADQLREIWPEGECA